MVAIIPSLDLVIVRMGLKEEPEFDFNGMLKGIVGVWENQINKLLRLVIGLIIFSLTAMK
jgi:hypothetical protein